MSSSHCTLIEQQSVSDKKLSADTVDELQKFDVLTLKTDNCSISEALRVNIYASFKNIKFPRGNYHTDSSET